MAWKLVAFDWDGTLVDTMQIAYQAMRTVFGHYRLEPPSKDVFLENITSGGMLAFYHERGVPRSATRQDLNAIWQRHFNDPKHHSQLLLREGAREALAACRDMGAKVSIVSGSTHGIITTGIERFGISDFIDHVEADASGKVDELRRVISHFSVDPNEMVYVDDTYEGLAAAKEVGISAIGILGGFSPRERLLEANPDRLIASLNDLLPLFGINGMGA